MELTKNIQLFMNDYRFSLLGGKKLLLTLLDLETGLALTIRLLLSNDFDGKTVIEFKNQE